MPDEFRPFKPDENGDRVPQEVYDLVTKLILSRGYGDVAAYRVMDALKNSWPGKDSC